MANIQINQLQLSESELIDVNSSKIFGGCTVTANGTTIELPDAKCEAIIRELVGLK
ncbi:MULTISPECIES: hypothetical protein [unclassified Moorena]|uniref:hypothetical protein n=1 Tax=unclassified Moorena TaxID=2683338 RepID=UPI0014017ABB|nr:MULTISPECIES: hypothetical protein [unclassified Moorena]NEO12832.1 hypothetical protein [Moorena sp. SIO3E8]NEQ01654.1 hypothetical protein [Moorena sp. SIO3F7]